LNSFTKSNIKCALRSLLPLLVVAVIGSGCAPGAKLAPQSSTPITAPLAQDHPRSASSSQQAWQVNRQQSLIAITVHRGGVLARLGHDHVVASRDIEGEALQDDAAGDPAAGDPAAGDPAAGLLAAGSAKLHFRLDQLTVDEPALRKEAGFDTQPGPDAIAGTRTNMLTRVLEAERFPLVTIEANWPAGTAHSAGMTETRIALAITLHGVTRTIDTLARIARDGAAITVEGNLGLNQSDFGIVPFSVMNGALAVKDGLDLRYRIIFNERAE
jgi:hypothetical protein